MYCSNNCIYRMSAYYGATTAQRYFSQKGSKQWAKPAVSLKFQKDLRCLKQLENVSNMGPFDMGANYR